MAHPTKSWGFWKSGKQTAKVCCCSGLLGGVALFWHSSLRGLRPPPRLRRGGAAVHGALHASEGVGRCCYLAGGMDREAQVWRSKQRVCERACSLCAPPLQFEELRSVDLSQPDRQKPM